MAKEKWQSSAGKPYVDNRNWRVYNEELIVRGEFLLDLEWVKSWGDELARMNAGKRGAPYVFPESLVELQAVWNQWVGVRQVEGITRKLAEKGLLPEFDSYSTVSRRVRKVSTTIPLPKTGFVSMTSDGSGFKMHNAGEYRHIKYGGKNRKWVRVIISANPLTGELLNLEVNVDGEGPSEPEVAMNDLNMLWSKGYTVDKFWGDGAFDVLALFNLLEEHNTESAIPPRDNASTKANGSMRRAREVAEYQLQKWADWAREKSYGTRWLGTEVIFSSIKRIFGENTRAKNAENACLETKRKFWAYNRMRHYAKT